jgi:hypothetical protein
VNGFVLWGGVAFILIGLWFNLCEGEPDIGWLFIGIASFTWWIYGTLAWADQIAASLRHA